MSARPVLLDVDTGVDDALALLFAVASPELDLRTVTCVGGNTDLVQVVRNTVAVLDLAGSAVPVLAGYPGPVPTGATGAGPAEEYHGADGLLGLCPDTPDLDARAARVLDGEHALVGMRGCVRGADEPVTVVPLAPQTNVAAFLRTFPDLRPGVGLVHFMGGSGAGGNVTAAAEYNAHHDPEALAVVLASGVPVSMYGLDVFDRVRVPPAGIAALRAAEHPAPRLAGELLAASAARAGTDDGGLGDAGAVAALVRPDLLTTRERAVEVQLGAGPARGMTVVDRRRDLGRVAQSAGATVRVAEAVDGPALADHVVRTLLAAW